MKNLWEGGKEERRKRGETEYGWRRGAGRRREESRKREILITFIGGGREGGRGRGNRISWMSRREEESGGMKEIRGCIV